MVDAPDVDQRRRAGRAATPSEGRQPSRTVVEGRRRTPPPCSQASADATPSDQHDSGDAQRPLIRTPAQRVVAQRSRLDHYRRVRHLGEHLGCVHRLDARRRQLEVAGIVRSARCIRRSTALRHEAVVGAEGVEAPLLEGRARRSRCAARPAVSSCDSPPRPLPRMVAPAGTGSSTHHPGHVRLRLDLEPHADHVAAASSRPALPARPASPCA